MMFAMAPVRALIPGRCLRWLVDATDAVLRRIRGITEFESDSEGLLRIELGRAGREILLSDGTRIYPDDSVIELHLWNEQLEPVPLDGVNFGWAARVRRHTLSALHRLALHIREDRSLNDVRALRMQPAVASRRPVSSFARLLLKFGFEPLAGAAPERGYLHRFLDNIWLWLLTWTHNPRALDGRRFNRERHEFWISRPRFLALYADGLVSPTNARRLDRSQGGVAAPKKSATIGGYRTGE
jgi:hypothetical protein